MASSTISFETGAAIAHSARFHSVGSGIPSAILYNTIVEFDTNSPLVSSTVRSLKVVAAFRVLRLSQKFDKLRKLWSHTKERDTVPFFGIKGERKCRFNLGLLELECF